MCKFVIMFQKIIGLYPTISRISSVQASLQRIWLNRIVLLTVAVFISLNSMAQYERYHGDGIDGVLQYVPIASVYILKGAGVNSQSSWKRMVVNTATSFAIDIGVTYALKYSIHSMRPDGTDHNSFPSGHTSMAFCGATILHKEFGKKSPWISVAGYTVAVFTAADRVRRNRHHWGDVLAGAAIGVASAEAGYRLGDLMTGWKKNVDVAIMPDGFTFIVNL